MKRREYHQQAVKRHYGGELRGLAHSQLFSQRGLRGAKFGPANRGCRLDAAERQAIEQKMQDEGRLWVSLRAYSALPSDEHAQCMARVPGKLYTTAHCRLIRG
jgi:hypothetical protein